MSRRPETISWSEVAPATLAPNQRGRIMPQFGFTPSERHFLSHWTYEASGAFWGPSTI